MGHAFVGNAQIGRLDRKPVFGVDDHAVIGQMLRGVLPATVAVAIHGDGIRIRTGEELHAPQFTRDPAPLGLPRRPPEFLGHPWRFRPWFRLRLIQCPFPRIAR